MPIRYNEASNDPIYLNEAAALVWKLSEESKNQAELLGAVCDVYNLKSDSVEAAAVEGFIEHLMKSKLIIAEQRKVEN